MGHRTIPIQPAHAAPQGTSIGASTAQAGCGGCLGTAQGPVCRSTVGQACVSSGPAQLIGPRDEIRRLLAGLAARLGFPADTPEAGGVRRLQVSAGEVELQLALPEHCHDSALAEAAFDTLRGLLRDTDIYVVRAA